MNPKLTTEYEEARRKFLLLQNPVEVANELHRKYVAALKVSNEALLNYLNFDIAKDYKKIDVELEKLSSLATSVADKQDLATLKSKHYE